MDVDAEQQAWVETYARRIETSGLGPMALPFLEFAKALGFLGSQALLLVQPLVAGFVDDEAFRRTVVVLESPELLEQLRVCLEGKEG